MILVVRDKRYRAVTSFFGDFCPYSMALLVLANLPCSDFYSDNERSHFSVPLGGISIVSLAFLLSLLVFKADLL